MPKERRRRYTNYSRPQSYLDPLSSDGRMPAADITGALLKEVRLAGKELKESRDEINTFKSAQKQREFDLQEKILKTKSIEKDNPMNTLAPQFNAMVNDVQNAYLEGFKLGDMSIAENKERNVNRAIDTILGVTATVDTESKKIQDMTAEQAEKAILQSQFAKNVGMITPEDRKNYLELLKDPSKLGYRYENGDWIIQLKKDDGYVDLFNGTEYKNAYEKDGFSLIKLADNYDEEIKTLSAELSKGLDDLETKRIETNINGRKQTSEELVIYNDAIKEYRRRLDSSPSLEAMINESNYQNYVKKADRRDANGNYIQFEDKEGSDTYEDTKNALIDHMVDLKYPAEQTVRKQIQKIVNKNDSPNKPKANYNTIAKNLKQDAQGILSKRTPEERLKQLLFELSKRGVRNKFLIGEDDDLYRIDSGGDFKSITKEDAKKFTESALVDMLNNYAKNSIPAEFYSDYFDFEETESLEEAWENLSRNFTPDESKVIEDETGGKVR